jgi:hypothetical protein
MKNLFFVFILGFMFVGCELPTNETQDTNTTQNDTSKDETSLVSDSYTINDGRLLVAQCAGCHGTNGKSVTNWDSIVGEGEFASETFHGIMGAQSYGYTLDQKNKIDQYLNSFEEESENEELESEEEENSESESEGSESEEESSESESNTSEEDEEDEVDETDEEDEDEEHEEDESDEEDEEDDDE